jgi:hypothetical protein
MWLQGKLVVFNDHPEGKVNSKKNVDVKLKLLREMGG